jgi:CRP/FNR family cyclic AMP-dependent transcriptional regulator
MDAARLEGVPLFASLSKGELRQLAQWADEVSVDEGYELATEGRFAHEFFVIEEGSAIVTKDGEQIAELGPGDFFGEIGLLETERRTATVVASSPMELIVMFGREFRQMERALPAVAQQVRTAIRERLSA